MLKKAKIVFVFLIASFLLTGCTQTLTDDKGETIVNKETLTNVVDNIICKPVDKNLVEIYKKNDKDISKLPACDEVKIFKWHEGIWNTVFVYPIAVLFIKIGLLFGNCIWGIIFLTLLSKIISYSSNKKIAENDAKMKKIQPQVDEINQKFAGKKDSASTIEKGDALKKLYTENNIKPMTGCFSVLIQFPILFAIIETMYRVPVFSESKFLGINLATAPAIGIKNGEIAYLILALSIIGLATLQSLIKTTKVKLKKQDFIMTGIIVFMVSSIAFSLPSGVAFYFFFSYLLGTIQNLIIRYKLNSKKK